MFPPSMWLVRLALRQPYTVAVLSFVLILMGWLSARSMLVDIFPVIDLPVVAVVWTYPGLSAEDMESRVTLLSERGLSSVVNGIERIESQSTPGMGLVKVYFQPGTEIGNAIAQIAASSATSLRAMPPGITPPYIIQANASNVPVAQMTLSSKSLSEAKIADYGQNFIRLRLFTIPGLSTPWPYGGKIRQIMIDVDPRALAAKHLSSEDVVTALLSQNVIIPAGTARIGDREYNIALNSSPSSVPDFATIPIKVVNDAPVTIGDVASVHDSYAVQTNIVRVDGRRAAYMTILKKSDASTLAVVEAARNMIPEIEAVAPHGLDVRLDFDQSRFVRAAVTSVVREALIAAVLVGLMVLLFLGSWRSAVVACASIPLAIAAAIIGLRLTGNSFNIMTLGGLSLSVGLLVDNATVVVENIHRNRALGKPLMVAILDAAAQISTPLIVATLAICIVFFPVVLLTGPARFLFVPMSVAVVIAMLASYVLSRTLVKTLARMLLAGEGVHHPGAPVPAASDGGAVVPLPTPAPEPPRRWPSRWAHRFNDARDRAFFRFQEAYGRFLQNLIDHSGFTLSIAGLLLLISIALAPVIGTDFFPSTDAGMMKIHFRAPTGTRIEETEQLVARAEGLIRQQVPSDQLQTINSMIGVPPPLNAAFVPTDNVSDMDAEILVALKPGHAPTEGYVRRIRTVLDADFPGSTIYFQTADIVGQVLNFGLSAPIDVQVQFPDLDRAFAVARSLRDSMRTVPGATDVTIKQVLDYPTLFLHVDRQRAAELGLTQRDVANSMLVSLSSSALVSPSYFVNPSNQVNYLVAVQVPLPQVATGPQVLATPITTGSWPEQSSMSLRGAADTPHDPVETIDNVATMTPTNEPDEISHYTVARVIDVTANVEGRDLGSVVDGVQHKIAELGTLPAGMHIAVRGQGQVMHDAFSTLALGFAVAVLLVYFLMVVLFQSWLDPVIIMAAVPGAVIGILWMLALTHTTINVVSLMGSIMAVGIAVANSILVVSFAHDVRIERGVSAVAAAIEAGKTRMRPVLMTALAMIFGMLPAAIGAGEGGEQNAPLGRAVIGGLAIATVMTLCVVPTLYATLTRTLPNKHLLEERFAIEARSLDAREVL